jgi:polysaccharide biosynthesis/export protein
MPLVAGKSNKGNGIFSTMFDQKRDMTRASFAGGRAISMLVLAATLAACAMPGMRMQEVPTLPADGASNTTDTHDVSVPISAIDMALIRNMRDQAMQDQSATGVDLFAAPGAYTLGAGDVLQIVVWDHPELAAALGAQTQAQARPSVAPTGFVIDRAGEVQFPYAGSVKLAGLTTREAQERLVQQLSRVYRAPQVTVRVTSFRAKQVYLDGEVRAPGVQPINDIPMTLYEAVNRAGGFSPAADQSRMVLVRNGVSHRLNLSQMLANHQDPSRIVLISGDVLRVQARDESGVFVMGEINKPASALPMRNGKLSLSDALLQAGSINLSTSNAAKMYVIRGAVEGSPHVYQLDASSPVAMLLANHFELQPEDVVYVDSTGLARFSRILGQLLPAINAGLTAAVVGQ